MNRSELLSLWNESCEYDQMTAGLFEEKTIGDPDDAAFTHCEYEDDTLVGFVHAVTRMATPPTGYIKFLAVRQDYRDRGIGSRLLALAESALESAGATRIRIAESAPNYLTPGLDPRYTRAMVFLERRGYRRFGETWNLSVDLEALLFDDIDGDADCQIRRATETDKPAVLDLLRKHWPAWIPEVSRAFENEPASIHIALDENEVCAFSAYDSNNVGTGWFGPMGTAESSRGKGIGRILLLKCLQDIKRQGLSHATIPWVGPIGFYSRHANATVDRVFYRYEKEC